MMSSDATATILFFIVQLKITTDRCILMHFFPLELNYSNESGCHKGILSLSVFINYSVVYVP